MLSIEEINKLEQENEIIAKQYNIIVLWLIQKNWKQY